MLNVLFSVLLLKYSRISKCSFLKRSIYEYLAMRRYVFFCRLLHLMQQISLIWAVYCCIFTLPGDFRARFSKVTNKLGFNFSRLIKCRPCCFWARNWWQNCFHFSCFSFQDSSLAAPICLKKIFAFLAAQKILCLLKNIIHSKLNILWCV